MQYEEIVTNELKAWQRKMVSKPTVLNKLSKSIQVKMNSYIPEKVHRAITVAIKQMIRGVLFGAKYITPEISAETNDLQQTEEKVLKRINAYKHAAAAEGGITGAGGFLLALAEFPVLIGIKLKLLFDIASLYGYSVKDYKERIYILHIFQLAFSSQQHRKQVYLQMIDWELKKQKLPDDINEFDWRALQQEYRDYIDLAKMAQLIPGIGAVVGYVVNFRLLKKLGLTAMNAYRMRRFEEQTNLVKGMLPFGPKPI
ncbi:MAG TPA: EcsC family protein [Chitinophagaceae bacterium]|nr:EcsC family protein [Chitinophagaceae bacterium]